MSTDDFVYAANDPFAPPPWWLAPYDILGFVRRHRVRPALALSEMLRGFLIALLAMTLVFMTHWCFGLLQVQRLHPEVFGQVSPQLLLLEGAVIEEVFYRGLLLTALLHFWKRPFWSVIVSSLLFGLSHAANPHATPLSVFSNSLGGVMYAVPYLLTGRLWFSAGLHFGWNWVQGILFGFPMSGMGFPSFLSITVTGPAWVTGAGYGPEGGVIGIAARLCIIAASIALLARRRADLPDVGHGG